MVKETGIIMTGDHPKLILDLLKTMTRRVIKPQPDLLYGIYGDIIQVYHNRRAEDDRVDIKADTDFAKRQLYGWERWQDILTDKIQGFWEKGFRGVVSISRLQDREEGVFSCLLMPRQQASNDVSSSASMYGFPRYAPDKVNASEAFGWQPKEQQSLQSQVGDSVRELDGQNISQREQPQLQQPQLKNDRTGEGTYPLGGEEQNRQQETYSKGLGNKPTFYIRNMPYSIGDRLWVRENWEIEMIDYPMAEISYVADVYGHCDHDVYMADKKLPKNLDRLQPSIFMPRWASRILLEITDIRVERLQEITEEDAIKEGLSTQPGLTSGGSIGLGSARYWFMKLWDSLNAKRGYGWDKNNWVWVISFRLVV